MRVIDFMPIRGSAPDLVRIVEGVRGRVPMQLELVIRYDYGSIVPWVRREGSRLHAVAGYDALVLASPVETHGRGYATVAEFAIEPGDRAAFTLTWHPSYEPMPESPDLAVAVHETYEWWREWLVRAVAGEPAKLQILYGVTGERRSEERELGWLPGYEGSRPVRVGNAAVAQRQLDVYGELMDALFVAHASGLHANDDAWAIQRGCLDWLEAHWAEPDEGIWEVRGGRQQLTFSKVMAWTAFDRAVQTVEQLGQPGEPERWRALRDRIHAEVCARGFDRARGTFTQVFGSPELDASLLLLPVVGFLLGDDPRVLGTIEAIQRELVSDGFVRRYRTEPGASIDGLPGGEGVFLACSFWLVDALVLAGRGDQARALFERLLAIRNDVGLLSEEYDTYRRRLVGNFPQAFSHVALINSARNLSDAHGPAKQRASAGSGASSRIEHEA